MFIREKNNVGWLYQLRQYCKPEIYTSYSPLFFTFVQQNLTHNVTNYSKRSQSIFCVQ